MRQEEKAEEKQEKKTDCRKAHFDHQTQRQTDEARLRQEKKQDENNSTFKNHTLFINPSAKNQQLRMRQERKQERNPRPHAARHGVSEGGGREEKYVQNEKKSTPYTQNHTRIITPVGPSLGAEISTPAGSDKKKKKERKKNRRKDGQENIARRREYEDEEEENEK
ncbi:unnamed protein product [Calypogeia fissa]